MTLAGNFQPSGGPDFDLPRALAAEQGRAGEHGAGPGRVHIWRAPGIALGCGAWGQCAEHSPCAIVADARVDNPGELRDALGLGDAGAITNAALLLRAWARWEEDFLDHCLGDIACAIWDARRRRLILGRDAMGFRPLHFRGRHGAWAFSATPAGLLADPDMPRELDERFLAEAITQLPHDPCASHYRGIARVPPGHLVIIENDRPRLHRHWRPERIPLARSAAASDAAAALRAALDQAVRRLLPATGLPGCELSAGLDSTAVTALAARHLAGQGRGLVAYTAVPGGAVDARRFPGRIVDEGPLAALVARRYPNIAHVRITSTGNGAGLLGMVDRHDLATREMEIPSPNGLWADAIGEDARRRDIRVMLGAGMGNVTASYDGLHLLPTLARRGRLLALAGLWRGMRRWDRADWPWRRLCYRSFGPLLPDGVVGPLRQAMRRPFSDQLAVHGINPAFARATGITERLAARAAGEREHSAMAWRLSMLGDAGHVAATRSLFGVEWRDPMADRRLFELCLSIPPNLFIERGQPRALMRRAMAGIVPDEILSERRAGLQSADWPDRFAEARANFAAEMARLEGSRLAARVLDLPRLRRIIDTWPATSGEWNGWSARHGVLPTLTRAFGAGRFLRHFETANE